MSWISIRNWSKFQHYKNRRPPWVKFYVTLLDEPAMNALPVPARYLYDRLLLLAANYDNAIPNDPELIARLTRMTPRECREALARLQEGRWIKETRTKRRASKGASRSASALDTPETETETETETEKPVGRQAVGSRPGLPASNGANADLESLDAEAEIQRLEAIARAELAAQEASA